MESELQTVVDGNNSFAIDLYNRLTAGNTDNVFFSPSSISTALAMTWAGARGPTESEMADVLLSQLGVGRREIVLNSVGDAACRPGYREKLCSWLESRLDRLRRRPNRP